ncbi:hypothetical protein A6R68_11699, partial [Neotoma lepida]
MSDEEITYTTVRFHKSSSKLENQGKSDETQGPRGASHRGTHVEGHWFCRGIKCYFIMDNKQQWSGCKQTCLDCNLSLLKIDDDDEL